MKKHMILFVAALSMASAASATPDITKKKTNTHELKTTSLAARCNTHAAKMPRECAQAGATHAQTAQPMRARQF